MGKRLKYTAIASIWGLSLLGCQNTPETTTEASPPVTNSQSSWTTIQGEGVSLALPPQYEGGNPSTDLDDIEARLQELGPRFAQQLQALRQNPEAIALFAFDPNLTSPNRMTSVNIIPVEPRMDRDLATFVEETALLLEAGVSILDQGMATVGDRDLGRMIVQQDANGTTIQPLMYFVQEEEQSWIVMYTTTAAEFEQRLPDFEKSIASLSFVGGD
ncbi:MAG: hypothetical protein SAJ12_11240 [Jaaginema sp. PMC 1079.18]|nr:hypothetical protein [Jaaginema sp. PMC 1080.18]MEC4851577.1 hypothetical protein [Jaaginema sp. PMC 1079.18]MEC4867318.1 hypothetical protein [Jaaginema sp. PMC 1078.18]